MLDGWEVGDDERPWVDREPVRAAEQLAATGRLAGLVWASFDEVGGSEDYQVEAFLDRVGERLCGGLIGDVSTRVVTADPARGLVVAVSGELSDDFDEGVGQQVASNPALPADVVERLALSPLVDESVHLAAAQNPNCPPHVRARVGLLA